MTNQSVVSTSRAVDRVAPAVTQLAVETPSWGYGNSGTRFKVFAQPGVPRDPFEKVEDAATVRRFTGVARSIALHIPWDRVDDYAMLANVFPEEVAHAVLFFASAHSAKST